MSSRHSTAEEITRHRFDAGLRHAWFDPSPEKRPDMMLLEQIDLDRELHRILASSMPGGKPGPQEDEAEEPDEVPEEE